MLALVERDHGGCDQEDCSLRIYLEDDYNPMLAIEELASTGSGDEEFYKLYDRNEKRIKRDIKKDNKQDPQL